MTDAQIDLWVFALDRGAGVRTRLAACLNAEEDARAARFAFDSDRERWTVARGVLRHVLAGYCERPATSLKFKAGSRGKPELDGGTPGGPLYFNLSHASAIGAIAVTRIAPVGIDVERLRAFDGMDDVAARFFAPAEVAAWRALPAPDRVPGFFRIWTRKEAVIKACGEGLSLPLQDFLVGASPGDAGTVRWRKASGATGAPAITLQHYEPGPGYAGAIAICAAEPCELAMRDAAPVIESARN